MRKILILTLVAFLLAGCMSPQPTPMDPPGDSQDDEDELPLAPGFELQDLEGALWSLEDLQGDVVMLYFWAVGCPACIEKMPELVELQQELPHDVHLLLVNGGDSVAKVEGIAADYDNLNMLLHGSNVFSQYGVRYTPTTVFINRDGEISQGFIGPVPNDGALEIINKLR